MHSFKEDRLLDISSLNSVSSWIEFIESNSDISNHSYNDQDWKAWLRSPNELIFPRNFNQSIEDHKALQKLLEKKNIEMQESISQLKKV